MHDVNIPGTNPISPEFHPIATIEDRPKTQSNSYIRVRLQPPFHYLLTLLPKMRPPRGHPCYYLPFLQHRRLAVLQILRPCGLPSRTITRAINLLGSRPDIMHMSAIEISSGGTCASQPLCCQNNVCYRPFDMGVSPCTYLLYRCVYVGARCHRMRYFMKRIIQWFLIIN